MNKNFKSIIKSLIFFLGYSLSVLVNAAEYDQSELNEIIAATQEAEGIGDLSVELIFFARGIQSYELKEDGWAAAGPLASLHSAIDGTIGDEKIGTHYSHLPTPAWEVTSGRVLAESAVAIPKETLSSGIEIGADDNDVAWLNVKLQPNEWGYQRILRVVTTSGVSPRDVDNYRIGAFVGTGYTTFYVVLK